MVRLSSPSEAEKSIQGILEKNKSNDAYEGKISELFTKEMRLVLSIGVVLAILQQITGINSVFFYAPMIFEQAGVGTDASFAQAIYVGLVNLVFTVLAILFIDKVGRKPLLIVGVSGIVISMFVISYEFNTATYSISEDKFIETSAMNSTEDINYNWDQEYASEDEFKIAMKGAMNDQLWEEQKESVLKAAIQLNPITILIAILSFVASFAISVGPVMWVLFSELFPNTIRGIAISFVGLINSAVSFLVQWVFPWELEYLGSDLTFLIYGLFALAGLIFIIKVVPETKGKTLEEIETQLVK